jgi:NAD(P)-dependent dehydrogenase (short-subunit alcohol dehydrogenase family)
VIVANAGIASHGPAVEQSELQWDTMLDTNLKGQWHTAKAGVPHMIEAGNGGSLIFTSSLAGLKGFPNSVAYTAAKFGVVGISRVFAHELAPHKIRSNSVNPTNVHTTMLDNDEIFRLFRPDLEHPTFEDAREAYSVMNIWPLPWVEPEDISNAVLFLASDESRYVTGISLPVDLGASAK